MLLTLNLVPLGCLLCLLGKKKSDVTLNQVPINILWVVNGCYCYKLDINSVHSALTYLFHIREIGEGTEHFHIEKWLKWQVTGSITVKAYLLEKTH